MAEELKWNEGLQTYAERRDFWTGAEQPAPGLEQSTRREEDSNIGVGIVTLMSATRATSQEDATTRLDSESAAARPSNSETSTPTSNTNPDVSAFALSSSTLPSTRTSQTSDVFSSPNMSPCQTSPSSVNSKTDCPPTLIPLAPPLLLPADHPDLAEITPATYTTIYSKCVVQALAPSFPINLKDVVGSLVQGWKDDGEWPPKATAPEKSLTVPKRDSLRERMRGLRVDGDDDRLERAARRSVGKVKRALGR